MALEAVGVEGVVSSKRPPVVRQRRETFEAEEEEEKERKGENRKKSLSSILVCRRVSGVGLQLSSKTDSKLPCLLTQFVSRSILIL